MHTHVAMFRESEPQKERMREIATSVHGVYLLEARDQKLEQAGRRAGDREQQRDKPFLNIGFLRDLQWDWLCNSIALWFQVTVGKRHFTRRQAERIT